MYESINVSIMNGRSSDGLIQFNMFRRRLGGAAGKERPFRRLRAPLKRQTTNAINDDADAASASDSASAFDDTSSISTSVSSSSSNRDRRVQRRARQILKEEDEAQQLAAALRPPTSRNEEKSMNKRPCNDNSNDDRRYSCAESRRGCCWNDTTWMRPLCITPLITMPLYTPSQTFISSSVGTVCNAGGGCYTTSQPIATTCTPFGCSSVSIAPPNLASVRDIGYGGYGGYGNVVGAACSMF